MLRKLCKLALLPGLLALGPGSGLVLGQAQSAPVAVAAPATPAVAAAIWAATARYVYEDDPGLQPMLAGLRATTQVSTVDGFRKGLNKAVALEGRKPKDSHVFMFQTQVFEEIQRRQLAGPSALAAAIKAELLQKHPERQQKPAFQDFVKELNRLTAAADMPAAAPALAPDPAPVAAAASPAAELLATAAAKPAAPPAAPASPLLWLALGMSALSLLGTILLWLRKQPGVPAAPPAPIQPVRVSRQATQENITWDEVKRYVDRQLDERQAAPVASVAAPDLPVAVAASQPVAAPEIVSDPAPRLRTQYVGEAPFNNSFTARSLSDQPSAYSMFAIESTEQQPDQGTFAVTGNLASHVRDHRSVLEPVCEYVGGYPQGSEARVVTEQPGRVRRRGSDWEIVERARVRFE